MCIRDRILPGDVFVAYRGEKFDGHDYVKDCTDKGAVVNVTDHEIEGCPCIVTKDTVRAVLDIAGHFRRKFSPVLVGVTGSVGKTTTIGKLAHQLRDQGKKVLLCAGDTFRAAAADQLEIWSERAHCDIIRQHEGADPASVVYDAIAAAKARGSDVIICDTAGRLHNKQNLMNELNKISRILDRELPNASKEVLLVLDGTTGQNGLLQAKQFQECAGVTGMVLTKLDGTAKGGVVIAVAQALQIPVKFIGVGEQIDDLMPFDAKSFAEALI